LPKSYLIFTPFQPKTLSPPLCYS